MIRLRLNANKVNANRHKKKLIYNFIQNYKWRQKVIKNCAGRNITGQKTLRTKGKSLKKFYSLTLKSYKLMTQGKIIQFVSHSRLAKLFALIRLQNGSQTLIPAVIGMKTNATINLKNTTTQLGSILPITSIKPATFISNVELKPNLGAQLASAPGSTARLLRPLKNVAFRIRLPSKKVIFPPATIHAQIGKNANFLARKQRKSKAGYNQKTGTRQLVRGIAMNPCSHPHGGSSGPGRSSRTPWGKPTK